MADDLCPPGFDCVDGVCVEPGAVADARPDDGGGGAVDAGGPDGMVNFCVEATKYPPSESCAIGEDLTDQARMPGGVRVYGTTEDRVNDVGTLSSTCLSLAMPGRDAIYEVRLEPGDTVTATLVAEWNSAIYLIEACVTGSACYVGDTNGMASSEPETISHLATAAQSFYIVIDNVGPDFGCYRLDVLIE